VGSRRPGAICCRSRRPARECDVRVWVVWNAQRTPIGDPFGSVVCAFYTHFDFETSPTDPLHLLLLIKDARSVVGR